MTRPLSVLIALSATALWLGLAVLGWGGFHAFFANPARVALVAVTFLLMLTSSFTKGNLSSGEEEDRGNRWVLLVFFVVGVLDGWLPAYCDRVGLLTAGGDGVRWTGVALFAIGGALRIAPVFVLGRRFSGLVAIQNNHELVTDGLYRVIRNPSYLGLMNPKSPTEVPCGQRQEPPTAALRKPTRAEEARVSSRSGRGRRRPGVDRT
jgi:hypothetical protein